MGKNPSSIFFGSSVILPAAPTLLTTVPFSVTRIDLTWADNASDELSYKIYRSTDGSAYSLLDTVAAGTTTYQDSTITAGVNYWYKVAAVGAFGESESNVLKANTLTLNLLSWWTLNESSDGSSAVTRNDSHGTNHLTDSNTTQSITGLIGNAASFNGANSERLAKADAGAGDTLRLASGDWSISFWVKPETTNTSSTFRALVYKQGAGGDSGGYKIRQFNATVQVEAAHSASPAAAASAATGNVLSVGNYTFVSAWYTTSNVYIQTNNSSAIISGGGSQGNVAYEFALGRRSGFDLEYYTGVLDEVSIWKGRALESSERTALYNSGSGITYTSINQNL